MTTHAFEEEEFVTQFNGDLMWRIVEQTFPHRAIATTFVVSVTLSSLLECYLTYLGKQIIDQGILARDPAALKGLIAVYGGILLVQAILVFLFIAATGRLGQWVQYDLRRKMFRRLQELSFSYYDRTPLGWIMSRVVSDSRKVGELVSWGLLDVTWGVTNIILSLAFMAFISWRLTLAVFFVVPALVLAAAILKRWILGEFRLVRKLNSRITGSYAENIAGVKVVKSINREEGNLGEFRHLSGRMYTASYRAQWLSALMMPTVQVISAVGVGIVVLYGGFRHHVGGLSIGGIHAFISYITMMLWPALELARVYASMQQAVASGERVFSLLDAEPEIVDRARARAPGRLEGRVRFEDVSFRYAADAPVLSGFELEVEPGETVALVGSTGAGKSTIVNLLCRFYEPTGGRILIDEVDYRDFTVHGLQSRFGIVLQTPHLFSGTIAQNIRYGRPEATDARVEEAARLAGAREFIEALDNGFSTEVGECGGRLSVGEKQLISLARAILIEPDIFVMDEATSSVDTRTERAIQEGMEALLGTCTSFVIAHRLSTIRRADRILVIEAGRILESGSHPQLLAARGRYHELYHRQFQDQTALQG